MAALREVLAHFGVSFDDAALKKGSTAIEGLIGKVTEFGAALGGGLAIAGMFHFIHGLTEEADALAKQADAMGLSLAEMQEWNYAAMMQGVNAETLSGVLNKLGSGKFDKGLADLKISTKDASGELRNSTDILEDVADSLSSIENPAERNRKAVAVLGKSYAKMLPLLQDGSKGIKELRKEFVDLGGGFSPEFAKQADEFGDNIDRIKTVWKNLTIMVVGSVLPALVSLSKYVVAVIRPLMGVYKHSKLLETGLIALGLKGIIFLSAKIGPLGKALKALTSNFFRVLLPLLLLEDALVFLAGGDSLLGRAIDKAFGAGKADAVRKWIMGVWKEFLSFIDDIKKRPLKLLDDWQVFTSELSKDVKKLFGDEFGQILIIAGQFFVGFIDMMTGGWDNFARKAQAIWDFIKLGGKIAWTELEGGFVNLAAIIGDAFISIWNKILDGVDAVYAAVIKATRAMHLISEDDKNVGLAQLQKDRAGRPVADLSATVNKARDMNRTALADEYDRVAKNYNQSAYAPQLTTQVQVTVPPGTPADMAKNVGAAAAAGANKGTGQNMKAAQAALKPGGQ